MNTPKQQPGSKGLEKKDLLKLRHSRVPAKKIVSAPPGAAKGDDDLMSKQQQAPK